MLYLSILISFFISFEIYPSSMGEVFGNSSAKSASHTSRSKSVFGSSKSSVSNSSVSINKHNAFGVTHSSLEKSSLKKVFDNKSKSKSSANAVAKQNFSKHASKTTYVGGVEKFIFPTKVHLITSSYGWRTSKRFHDGIDIGGKLKTPIFAAARGVVIYNDNRISGYGNMIVIKHPSGFSTVYAHCYKTLVKKGTRVAKGEKIALMGRTGHATGVHLHFEIRDKDGYSKNPVKYLPK